MHKQIHMKHPCSYQSTASEILRISLRNIFMNIYVFYIYRLHLKFQPSANKLEPFMTHAVSCFTVQYKQVFGLPFEKGVFVLICYVPLFFHSLAKCVKSKFQYLQKYTSQGREAKPNSEGFMNE